METQNRQFEQLFSDPPLPKAFYHPSKRKDIAGNLKQNISVNKTDKKPEGAPAPFSISQSDREFLNKGSNLITTMPSEHENSAPMDETWPSTERASESSIGGGLLPDNSSMYQWMQSPNDKVHSANSEERQHGDSVLHRYIERFRKGEPQSREERQRVRGNKPEDFWWLKSGNGIGRESVVPDYKRKYEKWRKQPEASQSQLTEQALKKFDSRAQKNYGSCLEDDKVTQELQEKADKIIMKSCTVSTVSSVDPEVSTEGLNSTDTLSSTLVPLDHGNYVDKEIPYRPAFVEYLRAKGIEGEEGQKVQTKGDTKAHTNRFQLDIPIAKVTKPSKPEDDILYQWRLRRKMDMAREATPSYSAAAGRSPLKHPKDQQRNEAPAKRQGAHIAFTPSPAVDGRQNESGDKPCDLLPPGFQRETIDASCNYKFLEAEKPESDSVVDRVTCKEGLQDKNDGHSSLEDFIQQQKLFLESVARNGSHSSQQCDSDQEPSMGQRSRTASETQTPRSNVNKENVDPSGSKVKPSDSQSVCSCKGDTCPKCEGRLSDRSARDRKKDFKKCYLTANSSDLDQLSKPRSSPREQNNSGRSTPRELSGNESDSSKSERSKVIGSEGHISDRSKRSDRPPSRGSHRNKQETSSETASKRQTSNRKHREGQGNIGEKSDVTRNVESESVNSSAEDMIIESEGKTMKESVMNAHANRLRSKQQQTGKGSQGKAEVWHADSTEERMDNTEDSFNSLWEPSRCESPRISRGQMNSVIGQVVKNRLFDVSASSVVSSLDVSAPMESTAVSHDHNAETSLVDPGTKLKTMSRDSHDMKPLVDENKTEQKCHRGKKKNKEVNEDDVDHSDNEFSDDKLLVMLRGQRSHLEEQLRELDKILAKLED